MEENYRERAYIDCRLWDRESGIIAVPGVGDFIRSRLPDGYWVRSKVDEKEMIARFSIRTNPSDEYDIDIPIVEIAGAIAEAIPKMFPGLFRSITSEAAIEVE